MIRVVSDVVRTNPLQVWFVAEHVVDTPVIKQSETPQASASSVSSVFRLREKWRASTLRLCRVVS